MNRGLSRTLTVWFSIWLLAPICGSLFGQRFHPSDPMRVDDDRLIDVVAEPAELELSDMFDRFSNMFLPLGEPGFSEALNVNSLGEVPDSSWFTNRHCFNRMKTDALCKGPNFTAPPDVDSDWMVFRGKSQGVTPGFHIEDSKGDRYVIKFDPIQAPELATAAEIIATRIFFALGYNVPENYIVYVDPKRFKIREGTRVTNRFGDKVPLTETRLRRMLAKVHVTEEGLMRVTASKYIPGRPIGPFRYFGTRSDDPNDVIPHEQRRELRGLRLFAAWTNHDDTRAQNTQDSWIEEEGRRFIRHYLMDFGSTFGSGSVKIQDGYLGFYYSIPLDLLKENALRFGLNTPIYRKVDWPDFPEFRAIGRWESENFDPVRWRNDYRNAAFIRMTAQDAFWAARTLMSFSSEDLWAIVRTGQFTRGEDEQYFYKVLLERQRKCGEWGVNLLNPVDVFGVRDSSLTFKNLSEHFGFTAPDSTLYEIVWHEFDNIASRTVRRLGGALQTREESAALPPLPKPQGGSEPFLLAEIRSIHPDFEHWARPVRVYLRPNGSTFEIVGVERESPLETIPMD